VVEMDTVECRLQFWDIVVTVLIFRAAYGGKSLGSTATYLLIKEEVVLRT
jgi:hypothetical protein